MPHVRLLFLVLLSVAVSGCVSTQPRVPSFTRAAPPAEGTARVYVIRPAFSEVSRYDSPVLAVDGVEVAKLGYDSYTDLSLRPGSYRLSLRAGVLESSVWNGDWKLNVEDGKTYFLAIWNQVGQEKGLIFLQGSINLKPYLVPWIGDVYVNKQLRYEVVSEEDALPVMTYMEYAKPNVQELFPKP